MPSAKRQRQREAQQARKAELEAARRRAARQRTVVFAVVIALGALLLVRLLSGGDGEPQRVATATSTSSPGTSAPATNAPATTGPARRAAVLPKPPPGASISGDTPCPKADGSSPRTTRFAKPPPRCIDPARTYRAEMKTNKGSLTITLDPKQAPETVNNFVVLARYHYFDGISFHRIIPGFVIQGGDPEVNGMGGPGYRFKDELPAAGQYKEGSLAMANSGKDTNGSQFFVITGPQGVALQPNYSLFGQVTAGMETVRAIEAVGTPEDGGPDGGKPTEVVTMESVTIVES